MVNNGQVTHQDWVRNALLQYQERLFRYTLRLVGCPQRAEDIVQDAFLQLCRQSRMHDHERLSKWLFTVCRNRAIDIKRKESRMTVTVSAAETAEDHHSPELKAVQADENSRVLAEIAHLSDIEQECLRLKFQEGMTYRQIAEITNLSTSHVGVTLHAAIKKLRHRLSAS